MVAVRRNTWLIPVGSFALAVLLSIISGPVRVVVARQAGATTNPDLCHKPTRKDGENDAGGKADGKKITTEAQGNAAQFGYVNDVEFFTRKPTGEVRYFAGAKNGAKVPGLEKKTNDSMRGWTLIHGATGDCCHPVTLETDIVLHTFARVTKPEAAGLSVVHVEAVATVDQSADNCAKKRGLKKTLSRTIVLLALRSLDSSGNRIEVTDGTDSDGPGFSNSPFDSSGSISFQVNLRNRDDWFFREDTEMKFDGAATIKKVEAGPGKGADQVAEGVAWVFTKPSRYSVADNGKVNQCSN